MIKESMAAQSRQYHAKKKNARYDGNDCKNRKLVDCSISFAFIKFLNLSLNLHMQSIQYITQRSNHEKSFVCVDYSEYGFFAMFIYFSSNW